MTGKDVPLSTWPKAQPCRNPCGCTRFSIPAFAASRLHKVRDVEALRAACSRRAPTGIRNRALLAVLFRSGLRISEALALFPKDLDLTGGSLRVLHGKGDKARTAPLPTDAADAVDRWLECRKRLRAARQGSGGWAFSASEAPGGWAVAWRASGLLECRFENIPTLYAGPYPPSTARARETTLR